MIPLGAGQRSDAEANRLVDWLLFNGIEVRQLRSDSVILGQDVAAGSYVVDMAQAHRGLAETALGIGVDVSSRIGILYAPPAAWSHGYLWGADTLQVPNGVPFTAKTTQPIEKSGRPRRRRRERAGRLLRPRGRLGHRGADAERAAAGRADGEARDGAVHVGRRQLPGRHGAVRRRDGRHDRPGGASRRPDARRVASAPASLEDIDRSPRIAVFTNALDQSVWSLRNLGFTADPVGTTALSGASNPLVGYDVIFSTANYPANTPGNATARARLAAFFAAGGGNRWRLGGRDVHHERRACNRPHRRHPRRQRPQRHRLLGQHGGARARSRAHTRPRTRPSSTRRPGSRRRPAGWSIDANLPIAGFAAGLWLIDAASASAPGAPMVAHGTSTTAGTPG